MTFRKYYNNSYSPTRLVMAPSPLFINMVIILTIITSVSKNTAMKSMKSVSLDPIPPIPVQVDVEGPNYGTLWNAALCKPTDAIDSYSNQTTPNKVVDGNRNPEDIYEVGSSCWHAKSTLKNSWWMVDLMGEYLVHSIVITNRGLDYGWRFIEVDIDLFLTDPRLDSAFPLNTNGVLCNHINSLTSVTQSFDCISPTYARYVKLMKRVSKHFHFCEVEVMASRRKGNYGTMTNAKSYTIYPETIMVNEPIVLDTNTVVGVMGCMDECLRWGFECTGWQWKQSTKSCRLLAVKLYDVGAMTDLQDTDLYLEMGVECIGDGVWKFV